MKYLIARIRQWLVYALWVLRGKPAVPDWTSHRRENSTIHSGFFVTYGLNGCPLVMIPGRIIEWPGLPNDVYLYNPPLALRQHPHGSCLQLLQPGDAWFKLHWQRPAKDFNQSCAYIEQLMAEVI